LKLYHVFIPAFNGVKNDFASIELKQLINRRLLDMKIGESIDIHMERLA